MGVGGQAGGCPAPLTPAPPHFPGEAGGRRRAGGRGGCSRPSGTGRVCAAPALAPPVPAQLPLPAGPGRAAWGGGAGRAGAAAGLYNAVSAGAGVFGLGGGGRLPRAPARGLSARAGWGAGEDAPASPGVSFLPTLPGSRRAGKDCPGEGGPGGWGCVWEVGNVLVCVFNSSGVLIRLGVVC